MVNPFVQVDDQAASIEWRGGVEQLDDVITVDESSAPDGDELADGNAAAGDDERLAVVKAAHDRAAVVAQLTLRDRSSHDGNRSTGATMALNAIESDQSGTLSGTFPGTFPGTDDITAAPTDWRWGSNRGPPTGRLVWYHSDTVPPWR
ncbi:MAG: hypothetical protein ACR2HQ_07530 [Ilumatobacteraceae bacterium]